MDHVCAFSGAFFQPRPPPWSHLFKHSFIQTHLSKYMAENFEYNCYACKFCFTCYCYYSSLLPPVFRINLIKTHIYEVDNPNKWSIKCALWFIKGKNLLHHDATHKESMLDCAFGCLMVDTTCCTGSAGHGGCPDCQGQGWDPGFCPSGWNHRGGRPQQPQETFQQRSHLCESGNVLIKLYCQEMHLYN